ncbi:hypothetical protein GM3708_2588 [Geminocystis sp. NIES-3708]|uniref:hypothetical protein n=1 Tax=Geminocystis sp. NIES-3708 TaxID=1615909 RepID=UPI0005FCD711|nr:hypothetical protein [Geminocystis sp. NIES-3708]BAQ62182.1 hypothetical protein GM3708_2588 [Geminocystis sp. NIES-3708]
MTEKKVYTSLNLTINLPLEWQEKIKDLALEKQISLSELITDIIGEYLDENITDIKINRLQENYQKLNQRLITLEKKDYSIERLQHRLDIMEKLIASVQNNFTSIPFDQLSYSSMISYEIEDEPDEILTDFLD